VICASAIAAESALTVDAADAAGRKTGSITVERAGDPWTADGKTFAPFSVVVRNTAAAKAHFFGNIALDGGKAGDCNWYAVVDAGATKRIEKPCKQRRVWSDFAITAKAEVARSKAAPTPTPTPEPIVP
jgi:hypothetical protein